MSINVAIVEDDEGIREGLAALVRAADGVTLAGSYASAEEALVRIPPDPPDVVLMDINLPGLSGIECVRRLRQAVPSLQVLMLTVYEDAESIFDSLSAGASGYLLKRTEGARLLEAIAEVHAGGSPMSGQIARRVVQSFQTMGRSSTESENLTRREEEILALLARGYRYKEVAEHLFISPDTVRTHIHNIYEKLHVRSKTEAVVKYFGR